MYEKKEKIKKNLEPAEIGKRIDKLIDEIIYSEDSEYGHMHLLFQAVRLMASSHAIIQVEKHEKKFHKPPDELKRIKKIKEKHLKVS